MNLFLNSSALLVMTPAVTEHAGPGIAEAAGSGWARHQGAPGWIGRDRSSPRSAGRQGTGNLEPAGGSAENQHGGNWEALRNWEARNHTCSNSMYVAAVKGATNGRLR